MITSGPSDARQIAEIARRFQKRLSCRAPERVEVLLGQRTLAITLRDALSPAEKELSRTLVGAQQVREFHQQLFNLAAADLHSDIKTITGAEVKQADIELESGAGGSIATVLSGNVIQVFSLSQDVPLDAYAD